MMNNGNHFAVESKSVKGMNAGRGLRGKVQKRNGKRMELFGSTDTNTRHTDSHTSYLIALYCREKLFATIATILRAAILDTYSLELMPITFVTAIQKAEGIWNGELIVTTPSWTRIKSERFALSIFPESWAWMHLPESSQLAEV